MARHELKTWPQHFQDVADGIKTYELRNNEDRHIENLDFLELREWCPDAEEYTGRRLIAQVIHVLTRHDMGELGGLEIGWCIFSLRGVSDVVG